MLEHKPEGGAPVDVFWLLLLLVVDATDVEVDATDVEVEVGGACVVWLVVPWVVSTVVVLDTTVDVISVVDGGARVVVTSDDEHPAVCDTSSYTRSLHEPLVSSETTQKKAPPLQANSPLL